MNQTSITHPLPTLDPKERARVGKLVDAETLAGFAKRSGASQGAVLRALGGLPVRAGTIALVRLALAEITALPEAG